MKRKPVAVDMRITIAERLKPFSHQPGTTCVLPHVGLRFQIFPEIVRVYDENDLISEVKLGVTGPVKEFTVQLDLEKSCIRVWGKTVDGFMRYGIYPTHTPERFAIVYDKEKTPKVSVMSQERLSLGSSKAQDWEMVKRRLDMTEILPLWFFLGQQLPKQERAPCEGTAALLHECRRAIIADDSRQFLKPFKWLFQAGFDGMLAPRLTDTEFQGFHLPAVVSDFSSLILLTEGAQLIKSLFFSYNDRVIDILPALPVEFHSGRFIHLECGTQGTLDMEWTKRSVRRLIFHAKENGAVRFALPRDIKQFRLRLTEHDRGQRIPTKTPIEITGGGVYYLDRFEK